MKDNSINIVQSYWSGSYDKQSNFGWYSKSFHYMSWALSSLKLAEHYGNVTLVTDSLGAKTLVDKLKLPYTSISCKLDELDVKDKHLWTLGKLYAYEMQDEPFIHVDGDVFIWQKFPEKLSNAPLIAQNEEKEYPFNCDIMRKMLDSGFTFPEGIVPSISVTESNAGIFGGTNTQFFKFYVEEARTFIKLNKERILKFCDGSHTVNTILEQYLFYELAKLKGIPVTNLLQNITADDFYKFNQFSKLHQGEWYIHALGAYKKKMITGERIARCLWFEYPEYYQRLMNLIKNDEL